MRLTLACFLLLTTVWACGPSSPPGTYESPQALRSAVPTVMPEKRVEFSALDTLFFQHLAYNSVAIDDGSFVLGDREGCMILHIDSTGRLIRRMAGPGRGPGEVRDVISLAKAPDGGILAYDQANQKGVRFDADMQFAGDIMVKSPPGAGLLRLYALGPDRAFISVAGTHGWIRDPDEPRRLQLARYDAESQSYREVQPLPARQYAPLLVNGRPAGGTAVPFAPRHLVRYDPAGPSLWTFWTASGTLARLDSRLDTVQTVSVNLPVQEISSAEIDSLEKTYSARQWDTVREMLPEQKTPIRAMHLGGEGRFWLKLSYRSDFAEWLIVDRNGRPLKLVQLPKGSMLTHVSKHHLGLRMGPATFALYEPVAL